MKIKPVDFQNECIKSMGTSFINYDNQRMFLLQTPFITLTEYGLLNKRIIENRYITLEQKAHLKIPYIDRQFGCQQLRIMMEQIDERMKKKNELLKIFPKRVEKLIKTYQYTPIIREPILPPSDIIFSSDEEEEEKKQKKYGDYSKFHFKIDYLTKKITTKFYIKKLFDHTAQRIYIREFDELYDYIKWFSRVRMILHFQRAWFTKRCRGTRKYRRRDYGIKICIEQIEIVPPIEGVNWKSLMGKCLNCIMFNKHLFSRKMLKTVLNRDIRKFLMND